ncbi:hypothetical protein [Streptomyces apocyni]|uniref:hypothetical protein n=1 Tax=Streptomyces apocyni TaxID=2654677 RepID=UPI0012EA6389|nr:hypothetical protein [Streptomyces apocyni]
MSIPGSQPNPYQHNPYQQQPGASAAPNPYQQQPAPVGQPGFPPLVSGPPPMGPSPARGRASGPLWGLGGAVLASAIWAGTLFGTGNLGGDQADLRGYQFSANLCDTATYDSLLKRYKFKETSTPTTRYASEQDALDQSHCTRNLVDRESSSSYSSTYVYSTATWHKKADPGVEFASSYQAYEDRGTDDYTYEVKPVGDLGDEAYLITNTRTKSERTSSIILAVRDGWFTYQVTWSSYTSSSAKTDPPSTADVTDMLTNDTRATLTALKES